MEKLGISEEEIQAFQFPTGIRGISTKKGGKKKWKDKQFQFPTGIRGISTKKGGIPSPRKKNLKFQFPTGIRGISTAPLFSLMI